MYTFRRSKVHRRSLLVAGASVAATLSLPRGSHGAESDAADRLPGVAHPASNNANLTRRLVRLGRWLRSNTPITHIG